MEFPETTFTARGSKKGQKIDRDLQKQLDTKSTRAIIGTSSLDTICPPPKTLTYRFVTKVRHSMPALSE